MKGVVTDNSPPLALQVAHNTLVIIALMQRLGLTEADIKTEELPQPGKPGAAIAITPTPEGGLVVVLIDGEVADAMIEGADKVHN